jgi:hypothetical protein
VQQKHALRIRFFRDLAGFACVKTHKEKQMQRVSGGCECDG